MGEAMSFGDHLVELRRRALWCVFGVLGAMIVAYFLCPSMIFPFVRAPVDAIEGRDAQNPFVVHTPWLDMIAEHYREEAAEREAARRGTRDLVLAPWLPLVLPFPFPTTLAVTVRIEGGERTRRPNQLYFRNPQTAFRTRLKLSLLAGIVLALPLIAYHVWTFVALGLRPGERRLVRVYGPASLGLFFVGMALAYVLILPVAIAFLLGQGAVMGAEPLLEINEIGPFVVWVMVGLGVVFQMPLVILFLTRARIVTPAELARARPYAIVAMFVAAAILTPPDVFTQVAVALPMLGLFEGSLLLARLMARRRERIDTSP
jgi:sec-independent protein translocase protein TatC